MTNNKQQDNAREWYKYFSVMEDCITVGNYIGLMELIDKGKTIFGDYLNQTEKEDKQFDLELTELEINWALDFGNKEAFIKATNKYNKLKMEE